MIANARRQGMIPDKLCVRKRTQHMDAVITKTCVGDISKVLPCLVAATWVTATTGVHIHQQVSVAGLGSTTDCNTGMVLNIVQFSLETDFSFGKSGHLFGGLVDSRLS